MITRPSVFRFDSALIESTSDLYPSQNEAVSFKSLNPEDRFTASTIASGF